MDGAALSTSAALCLPHFSWSQTCLYHGASETDLISVAGVASFQLFKLCSEFEEYVCSSLTKPRALFLLLGSGGLSLWILYRNKEEGKHKKEAEAETPKLPGRNVSWLRWLFSEGEKDFLLLREDPASSVAFCSPLRRKQAFFAPCPNCQRGTCRLRKHQMLLPHSNSSSSYENSPISRRESSQQRPLPTNSSVYSSDDENSDSDEAMYIKLCNPYVKHGRRRSGSWLSHNGSQIVNRSEGEGMSDPSLNGSGTVYYPSAKLYKASKRSPGDGQDHLCVYGPSSLSSGEACDCAECLASCRYEREESVDSIISATGSMVELIKGAREVRKLIREASFDSLTSDLSFNAPAVKVAADHSSSERLSQESEEEQVPSCLRINQSLNKNFYSMIALSSLDYEPSSSVVNSLEWESPSEGWHDVREAKYKMSLPLESDQELEWDAEISEALSLHEDEFISSSFVSGLELDMEVELLRPPSSNCSSRRSSLKRLPPSGRSSAEREFSEPPMGISSLSPLIELKEPSCKRTGEETTKTLTNKSSVPISDSLYISLKGSPPDNIEILNNNNVSNPATACN